MRFSPRLYSSRHKVFYYRLVVPAWLRPILGKSELRRSLGTRDPKEAYRAAVLLSAEIDGLICEMAKKKDSPSIYDIKHLILRNGVQSLEIKDLKTDPSNPQDQEFVSALTKAMGGLPSATGSVRQTSKTLREVISDYCADQKRRRLWADKTEREAVACLEVLAQLLGPDRPIGEIGRDDLRRFLDQIARLPPNAKKKTEFHGKSVEQILEIYKGPGLAASTLRKHMTTVSGFFHWAMREEHVTSNPARQLAPKTGQRASEQRHPFSREDLRRIFSQPLFVVPASQPYSTDPKFWVPVIAALSGARIEEICQLHANDLKQSPGGTWYFDINESDEDKRIKTGRNRQIPVHPRLIELGLLGLREDRNRAGEVRMFPSLKEQRDGYSQAISKWFGRFLRNEVGIKDRKKVFHSFRHTVASELQAQDVEQAKISAILGHSREKSVTARYTGAIAADNLKGEIEKLNIPTPGNLGT